jgi:hypothetical protein
MTSLSNLQILPLFWADSFPFRFEQTCKSSCLPGQYLKGYCDGQGMSDGIHCADCRTACDPGMYLDGECSGMGSVEGVQCYPCPAGTYSVRAGSGISSCVPCTPDSFSDPGSASCVFATRGWPLNSNVNEYSSADSSSGRRAAVSTGVVFVSNIKVQDRTHTGAAKFDGIPSHHITAQETSCSNLPREAFSVSLWVRVDQKKRSAFIGCFENNQQGARGWFLGTSASAESFVFALRSESAATATLLTNLSEAILTGRW